jgi:hypothetical protein
MEWIMSNEHKEETKYWFPAKTYGWGWGFPSTWQGWVVMILYMILIMLSVYIFPPDKQMGLFILTDILLTGTFIAVCCAKGEPPKWRWGKK